MNTFKEAFEIAIDIPFALLCINNYWIIKLYVEGCFMQLRTRDNGKHRFWTHGHPIRSADSMPSLICV